MEAFVLFGAPVIVGCIAGYLLSLRPDRRPPVRREPTLGKFTALTDEERARMRREPRLKK